MPRTLPFLLSTMSVLASTLAAQQAISPADRASLEGSSFTQFPLGRHNARMQTLHADVPGGTLITGHAYRRDAAGVRGQVDGFVSDLEIALSISPRLPSQASSTFALNAGPNPVVVLPRTVIAFPATQRPSLDPAPSFELVIPYQFPFLMPASGGTLCVDVVLHGNTTTSGTNVNFSCYLDSHDLYSDGRAEQIGFRTFQGCAAPGATTACTASMTYWRLPAAAQLDVALRRGVPETGSGLTRAFVTLGHALAGSPWPLRADCPFWSSSELWFLLPGTPSALGDLDASLTGLPHLPPGFRLWCQAGSIDLATADMAFSDAVTFVTPPPGPLPIPVSRIVNSTNRAAATGTVSYSVPVMAFL